MFVVNHGPGGGRGGTITVPTYSKVMVIKQIQVVFRTPHHNVERGLINKSLHRDFSLDS